MAALEIDLPNKRHYDVFCMIGTISVQFLFPAYFLIFFVLIPYFLCWKIKDDLFKNNGIALDLRTMSKK